MTHSDIIKSLKAKKFSPIYFLQGEESYFIDEVINEIEHHILEETEKSFNQIVLYGKECNAKQIVDQAMLYPMMAERRVVIVKEAQYMSKFEALLPYFQNPSPQTILAIAHKHKKLDKRKKKLWDALKKNAVILETKRLYDNQVPGFISDLAKKKKITINQKLAFIISEYLGSDLSKISNEIDKLALNLDAGEEVTADHIQEYIGISKDYNVFELQKALGSKNKSRCYQIIKYFSENEKAHPIQMNIGALYNYFNKLFLVKKFGKSDSRTIASKLRISPFFAGEYTAAASKYSLPELRNAFLLLHEMDKRSKGVDSRSMKSLAIYQEFLFKLFS